MALKLLRFVVLPSERSHWLNRLNHAAVLALADIDARRDIANSRS